jgi:hypothetical protein
MPTVWNANVYDFLVFSDTISGKPAYMALSDSLAFDEDLSTNWITVSILDYIPNMHDSFSAASGSVHHVELTDTMTFVDGAMRGGPQTVTDVMLFVDAFTYAENMLLDTVVFSDTITGVDAQGLFDSIVFTDTFGQPSGTHGASPCDTIVFTDTLNNLAFSGQTPNPWLPNFPTTSRRSGNPTCEESDGQEGLPY